MQERHLLKNTLYTIGIHANTRQYTYISLKRGIYAVKTFYFENV